MADAKVIAYYRVSTKAQGLSGLGLEAQAAAVGQYLAGGNANVLASYTDVESGTRADRPQLAKALRHAKRSGATLVIAKLDRLARNVAFVSSLMESGVRFVAADNPHATEFTIHILAAVAQHEAKMIARRTREALAAAKARGVKLGKPENLRNQALGTARGAVTKRKQAREGYAHVEAMVLNLRAGGLAYAAIADHLNGLGELTRQGAPYQPMTVKRLCNRAKATE